MSFLRDDEEPPRRRNTPRRRVITSIVSIVVVIGVAFAAFAGGRALIDRFRSTPDYEGTGSGTAYVEVAEGDTAADIAATMVDEDVVKSAKAFTSAAEDDPRSRSIQPGTYRLRKQMSGQSALALMLDPKSRVGRVTVPEGLTAAETLALLAKETDIPLGEFKAATNNSSQLGLPTYAQDNVEGFLFPSTYNIPQKATATDVLRMLVAEQRRQVNEVTLTQGGSTYNLSAYDVVIVASLLEQEGITSDFGKIARVIYNRLDRDRDLQLDSTVNYALHRNHARVTIKQTRVDSPYNTYRHKGLPPAPISNPGLQAIDAAMHPEDGTWLFFVKMDRDGNSFFTDDEHAFLRQKQKSQEAGIY